MVHDASELMARYCDGDPAALAELYAMTAPPHRRSYLKLHAARLVCARRGPGALDLQHIARRTAADELRRVQRRVRSLGRAEPAPRASVLMLSEGVESDAVLRERRLDAMLFALDVLPASQRAAIELTRLHGKRMAEVALLFGTGAGAVRAMRR